MTARRIIIPLVVLVALAPTARADIPDGVPDELSSNRLDRAALVAMPGVWKVEVKAHMTALRTASGAVVMLPARARTVSREGTAFGVTPEGHLVSAAHVVQPSAHDLAETAYLQKLALEGKGRNEAIARAWVKRTGAVPVGLRPLERVVRPMATGAVASRGRAMSPRIVTTDWLRDIVVLRVPNVHDIPSLGLDRGMDVGTPIATLGFGSENPFADPQHGSLVPAVHTGLIGQTGPLEKTPARLLTLISNEVQHGDSGSPAVDERGRVRGVVLVRRRGGGGAMAPTEELIHVLDSVGIRAWEGRTQTLYRSALASMSRYDLAGARRDLGRTLASYPDHGLAAYERGRVDQLAKARVSLAGEPWRRGGFTVAGISALIIAIILGVLLWKAVIRNPAVLGPRDRTPYDREDDPRDG